MNILKVIIFDIDRVLAKNDMSSNFSDRVSTDFGISKNSMLEFIKNKYSLCKLGKADLKIELTNQLRTWQMAQNIDEIINRWYTPEHILLNTELLRHIKSLRSQTLKVYTASNNEKYRAQILLNDKGLKELFDGHFFSYELGYKKPHKEYFEEVIKLLDNIDTKSVLFIDDKETNIMGANSIGFNTHLYTTNELTFEVIKTFIAQID